MNHIYRLVWSQVRRTWLVVSELARGRGKAGRASTPRRTRSAWWAALPLSLPMLALAAAPTGITAIDAVRPAAAIVAVRPALAPTVIASVASSAHPTGGQVTAGSGHIDYGDHLTTIRQNSQNLSLNWLSFNIGADSTVNFLQPNAQAIAVNRIADPNGSVILGHLNANGQVFLINPNGVLFGQGAQVDVGGLVASTLDLSDSELGRGTLHFAGAGGGSVTNRGTITAAPGGYVALLGHAVSNQGAIHAPAGSVALAGGSAVTLSFDGNHLLDMQVDASTLNALAENKQLIVADGGQVLMSAGAKDALLASVVNNTGTIQAQTVENRAGKIVLLGGMAAGTTQVDGTLDASAPNGGDGGFIETSAAHVQVADATKITTLAAAGNNGTWLIDPTDFTIAASGGDMTGATLSSQLGGGNVTIQSTDGSAGTQGNINVNDTVSWSANTLTLNALNDINVNAAMNASDTAGLALAYGQANPATGNTSTYHVNAPINLASTGSFSTRLGSDGAIVDYTVITMLQNVASPGSADLLMLNVDPGGHFVLGADIDASATASWDGGAGFMPVPDLFGTFDGLGHTITGLTINRPNKSNVGLFGRTEDGSIVRNVGLVGGAITGNGFVGNLVGDNHATISHVYVTGTVTDVSAPNSLGASGGLAGSNSGTITDAYATGAVTSGGYAVGGLVGFNFGTITNAYATGATSSGTFGVNGGGLVGVSAGTITNGYWDTDTASQTAMAGVTGLTTQQLIASLPAGFDPAIWGNSDNQATPYMRGWAGNQVLTRYDLPDATGARLYTVILDLDHLQAMQANLGGRYVLGNAIDASDTSGLNGGAGFVPLGTDDTGNLLNGGAGFTGTFDGMSYAISGLSIDRANRVGLFGYAGNGSILRNVRLLGGVMTGSDYVGGLVGQNVGGTIISSYTTNVVTGNDFIGGLAGSSIGTITDAYATGAVTGNTHVGGLVGENEGGTIGNAYATGAVTGNDSIGGLVGNGNGAITDAYATGAVTGNQFLRGDYVGGLVGWNDGGTITNVHATGVVLGYGAYVGGLVGSNAAAITHAYATGAATGRYDHVGGLVGGNTGTITNAYATGAATAGYNYVGGLVGSNTAAITNAYATGAVTGYLDYVGGLVGSNAGVISNAYATGAVTGSYNYVGYVGGLVGSNDGVISNAYATGAVAGKSYIGGLVGSNGNGGAISFAYATGNASGVSQVGGLVGFNDSGSGSTVTTSYWDTTTTVQTEGCGDTSCGSGATGHTTTEMMQLASFASWGANIDPQGGTGSVWRIYEGHTTPLLRTFLTPHAAFAQPDFDGSGAALANVASSNITVPTDPQILGSVTGGDTLTLAGLAAGGGYTASSNADLSGLYSTQQGYDFIGNASRTISTPGSAAGEVRLDHSATWSSGTLAIATAGNIDINGALSGDALRLNGGGTITDTAVLNVASFVLGGGNWNQIGATLPTFSATHFSLAGGSFVRALGGDGSSATPYQLADVYGLQGVGTLLGNSFTLSNNIDASAATGWNGGAGFAPIGNSTTQFTGIFDGLGHTISDLTINRPTQDNVGLFGFVGGTLRNIGLVGGSVSGANDVGGLVGQVSSGNISNAYATGTVSGNNYVGGLLGYFGGGSFTQSYATGTVSGVAAGSSYIGGLAGYLAGTSFNIPNVSDVYATGNVNVGASGSTNYIGGLAGYSSAYINNAYATGDINLTYGNYIGGLVGNNDGGRLEYVHATGNINISSFGGYVGGLAGSNEGLYGQARITYAYATGNINGANATYLGGLVGQNSGFIENSYATGNLVGDPDGSFMWAGGLVGRNGEISKSGSISNVYATGNVAASTDSMYLGGLAGQNFGLPGLSHITNAYSTGHVSGNLAAYSGGSVGYNNYVLQNVYWNTEASGQSSAGVNSSYGPNAIGLTNAQMMQIGSFGGLNSRPFDCAVCGSGISANGGTAATWRIYEGHTTPLLSVFLTPYTVNAQPDFDGSGAALTNIASVTVPTDPKILGSVTGGDTLTLAGLTAGGGYTASSNANLSGLYSTQQGYDLIGSASRTINTPGSVAGEVRLDNGASWSSGTLAIATAGNINIAGALTGGALRLNSGGTITDARALNVASFVLSGGNWLQLGATLPAFSATDFSLTGGSFVRALGGDGTSGNPWQLTDVYGLQGVGTLLGDSFTLGNDIDASAATGWNGGAGFAPIGNGTTAFTGSLDGLGHTISDLTIVRPNTDYVGLFGYTGTGSTISNIGLLSGSTTGRSEVGSLVGYNDGTINQAYANGAVSSSSYSGGLVGYNTGTINLAYATGAVNSSSYSGGLVGYNKGTISQAYAIGTVSGAAGSGNSSLGGLVGANVLGAISQAYATGAVNGGTANMVGGLVGWNDRGMIDQAYATGAVNGGNYVGGLVGFGSGSISRTYATGAASGVDYVGGLVGLGQTGSISQAYATGAVSGRYVGGLVGSGGSVITGSYWDMETTGQPYGCSCYGDVTGLTTAQMMDPTSFAGWDIATAGGSTSVWRIYAGHSAPLLRAFMTPLALSSDSVSQVYDGSDQTSSSFTYGTLTPGFWLPSASVDASLILGGVGSTMNARNVGTYTLDLSPYSGQMGYDIDYTAGVLTITPATLTLSAVGDSKTYDGATNSAGMVTVGGLLAGDSLTGLTQSFASKNVLGANASTLGVDGGYALDDGNGGGNYIVTTHTAAGTIAPYVVDLDGSRIYDGSTAVNAGDLVLGILVGSETLTLSGTGSMADKNVGNGKSFALGTLTLGDGTGDAANYILVGGSDTVDISKRTLTVDAIGVDKVYDGSTVDSVNLSSTGILIGDIVDFTGTGAFADKNIGTGKTVSISGIAATGTDASNYSFSTTANTTADITAKTITVDATGSNKVYDGSTADAVMLASAGVLSGDTVNFTGTGSFADKNVGTAKAVGVSGIAASGADAGNYSFNTAATTTADITAKPITVDATGVDKVYDGSTAAAISALSPTGLVSGDVVTFGNTSAAFDDKNAGTDKAITVNGITATGADAGNYSFGTTANTTANISQLGITVDATGSNKVYDGSTVDAITLAGTGVLSGDTVNFTGTGSFADKNVGTGKTVNVSGIAASGTDGGNYSFNTTATTTADITARTITVDATGSNKVYDGSTADAVALASTGVLSGDVVNFTGTGSFADKNVGTAKAVGVSGIAASGADAGNYSYNTSATTTADVTPATLTYHADTAHFHTGQMPGDLSGAVTGLVGGDTLAEATEGTLAWQTPATASSPAGLYAIDGSGLSALNYLFEQAPGNATALQVVNGSASRVVTTIIAGLQQDETSPDDNANTLHAPSVRIVDGGVRLP